MKPAIEVQLAVREFEGQPLTTYVINGAPCWSARDIGTALGYSRPRQLASNITQRWSADLKEGQHYTVLTGDVLAAVKATRHQNGVESPDRSPSLLVLFEAGVNLACMLTRRPKGVDFRRWLAEDVLPSIRTTGRYEVDGIEEVQAEARALEAPEAVGPMLAMDIVARAVEVLPDARLLLREQWVTAALAHAGLPVIMPTAEPVAAPPRLHLVDDGPAQQSLPYTPKTWMTPTDIAELENTSPQMVGRIISSLGLRDPHRPDVDVAEVEASNGRMVDSYRYTGEALAAIRAEVRGR